MYARPTVCVSECLEFSACRYNGQKISNTFVHQLKSFCTLMPVCPEVAIGLGIPRDPIRIVRTEEKQFRLYQPSTQTDLTEKMNLFSESYLSSLKQIDGFLMKASSPSCGVKGVAIYVNEKKIPEKRDGLFTENVKRSYPYIPIEDEGRLNNYHIRENYLIRIFTLAKFRELPKKMGALVQFQAENKYLFMTLHPKQTTYLGQIIANNNKRSIDRVFCDYEEGLYVLLTEKLKKKRTVNTLQHIFGYVSSDLNSAEKEHFLTLLESFRSGKEYLFTLNQLLWSWILRTDQSYLKQQTFFNPYPPELMEGVNYSDRMAK